MGTAVTRLGGVPLFVNDADLHYGRDNETLYDTARVASLYSSAIVVRKLSDEQLARLAGASSVPVINALSVNHHPCQAVSDLFTLRGRWGTLAGRKLAYVGAAYNVAHSLIEAGALLGLNIAIASPNGFGPDNSIVEHARLIADSTGAQIGVGQDPYVALEGADAVYTDTWFPMGEEHRIASFYDTFRPYSVTPRLMEMARIDAVFMHCMPARRGDEVAADVIDSAQSLVMAQARNRLVTSQAILSDLLNSLGQRS